MIIPHIWKNKKYSKPPTSLKIFKAPCAVVLAFLPGSYFHLWESITAVVMTKSPLLASDLHFYGNAHVSSGAEKIIYEFDRFNILRDGCENNLFPTTFHMFLGSIPVFVAYPLVN